VPGACRDDLECLVVFVATHFTLAHDHSPG
jgi:hypothetical protein